MIVKHGLWRAGIGLAVGLAAARLFSRYMINQLPIFSPRFAPLVRC